MENGKNAEEGANSTKNGCHEASNNADANKMDRDNSKRKNSQESSKLTPNGNLSKDCVSTSSTNISTKPLSETKTNISDHTIS